MRARSYAGYHDLFLLGRKRTQQELEENGCEPALIVALTQICIFNKLFDTLSGSVKVREQKIHVLIHR